MLLIWFALAIVIAGNLVIAGQFVAEAWRGKSGKTLVKAAGVALASYVVLPAAAVLALREGSWVILVPVAWLASAGAPAVLRVVHVHGRPVWPHVRDGVKASLKPSWSWLINALISLGILALVLRTIPVLERTFKDFGGTLPAPTQLAIDDCNWLRSSIVVVPMALAGLHLLFCWWEGLIRAGARSGTSAPVAGFRELVAMGMALSLGALLIALSVPVHVGL